MFAARITPMETTLGPVDLRGEAVVTTVELRRARAEVARLATPQVFVGELTLAIGRAGLAPHGRVLLDLIYRRYTHDHGPLRTAHGQRGSRFYQRTLLLSTLGVLIAARTDGDVTVEHVTATPE